MNKKSRYALYSLSSLLLILAVEILYINSTKQMNSVALEQKRSFVSLSGLPDLAIATEDYTSRHRSLSTVFDLYPNDGSLREYAHTSFALSHSNILNLQKTVQNEK